MSNEEMELGKIAYEAYYADAITSSRLVAVQWKAQSSAVKRHWIAAARAVAERVIAEMRTAERGERMSKVKKCVLCAEQGKDVPACHNNGIYCYFHMLCEMEIYSQKKKRTSRQPIDDMTR